MHLHAHPFIVSALLLCSFLLSSCSGTKVPTPNPKQTEIIKAVYVNPYKQGTYAHFTAASDYPKTYAIYRDEALLATMDKANTRVIVDLGLQRGFLLNNNKVALDYPVSTGQPKFPTPPGKYEVLKKIENEKRSNLYGTIYDAEGNVFKRDADTTKDAIPEGGRFEGALMPYWMRISWSGIGMHQGNVPRYPASHGCIRTYSRAVKTVFDKVHKGTPVLVR